MSVTRALLVATYELGRQPFGLASPAAWLRRAGIEVTCLDLSRQPFRAELASADFVAFHLPMHTATRLAIPVIQHVRQLNPNAHLCCYGIYAPLNAAFLRSLGVRDILGGEFEQDLADLAMGRSSAAPSGRSPRIPRLRFLAPDRSGLPHPSRYASLLRGVRRRVVGYTEASRGCKHTCRHCPVVPVYEGQFRVVPVEVVLADIRTQVEQGVTHVTFGDPDFFNGIGHAMRVAEGVAREFAGVTYDVTIKIEHLLRHGDLLARLRDTGCLLVTSAVESFDDEVLTTLRKGHTRADVREAVEQCRKVGVALAPTFVAFTPWTTLEGYCDFLGEIDRLDIVDHVAPIQLAIRLLVPEGSRLMEACSFRSRLDPYDPVRLMYPWRHDDARVDSLGQEIGELVGRRPAASRRAVFNGIWDLAHRRTGLRNRPRSHVALRRAEIPYLNEPWYC